MEQKILDYWFATTIEATGEMLNDEPVYSVIADGTKMRGLIAPLGEQARGTMEQLKEWAGLS